MSVTDLIDISKSGRNHFILSLKPNQFQEIKKLSRKDSERSYQPILTELSKEFSKAKPQPPSTDQIHAAQTHHLNNIVARRNNTDRRAAHTSLNMHLANSVNKTSSSWIAENYKLNFSTIEDYMEQIKKEFEQIFRSHSNGIDGRDLHRLISQSIGTEFDPRIFECKNLHEFIVNHFRSKVNIQLIENKVIGMLEVFYFPKNVGSLESRKANILGPMIGNPKDKMNPLISPPEGNSYPRLLEPQPSAGMAGYSSKFNLGPSLVNGANLHQPKHKRYSTIGNTQTLQTISESNKFSRTV